ncbi:hypothetical protein [Salipaludibacillus sp. CF4.18]
MNINEAYEDCRRVIEYHSKTFAKAFQHLPRKNVKLFGRFMLFAVL